jgi:hypothetical protein
MNNMKLIQQELAALVKPMLGVEAYKVEFSMWDHNSEPQMCLYVLIYLGGYTHSIHTRRQSTQEAYKEILDWYNELSEKYIGEVRKEVEV